MNRDEALQIADRLWAIVSGPKAGTTAPESLALVRRLTAGIQDDPELSVNLKLKADEVVFHCRLLFDQDTFEDSSYDEVDIVAALARNAVIKLRLVAETQLPSARTEKRDEPEPVGKGQPAQQADPPQWVPLSLGRLGAL